MDMLADGLANKEVARRDLFPLGDSNREESLVEESEDFDGNTSQNLNVSSADAEQMVVPHGDFARCNTLCS